MQVNRFSIQLSRINKRRSINFYHTLLQFYSLILNLIINIVQYDPDGTNSSILKLLIPMPAISGRLYFLNLRELHFLVSLHLYACTSILYSDRSFL